MSVYLHVRVFVCLCKALMIYISTAAVGVIAVVKASAYGHGSVQLSHHLKNIGVERLAVATIAEGIHLRKHHVKGPIHVFGEDLFG